LRCGRTPTPTAPSSNEQERNSGTSADSVPIRSLELSGEPLRSHLMYASTMLVALHDINSQLRTSSFIYGMATQRLATNKRPLVTWTKSLGAVSGAPAKNSERRAFRLRARNPSLQNAESRGLHGRVRFPGEPQARSASALSCSAVSVKNAIEPLR